MKKFMPNRLKLAVYCLVTSCLIDFSAVAEKKDLNRIPDPDTQAQEIVIEAVLASVDGVPITLRDFSEKIKRKVTIADFSKDSSLGQALDAIIMEKLVEAEAANRRIKTSEADIERYIEQVALQNNLNKSEFHEALIQQGKSLEEFKAQARLEILRSRLMGQLAQSAPAVTDEELIVDGEESSRAEEEAKIRYVLREIVFKKTSETEEQALAKANSAVERLDAGEKFGEVAKDLSEGPTASSGGQLGEIAESDLSESILEAVSDLSEGEYSEAVESAEAIRFFFLADKLDEGEVVDDGRKEQLRKQLETKKLEKRFEEFFTIELPKLHKVEKKV